MSNRYEIVGADLVGAEDFDLDLGGDDDDLDIGAYDIVGARKKQPSRQAVAVANQARALLAQRQRQAQAQRQQQQVIAQREAAASFVTRDQEPRRARRQPLGMNSTGTVAASSSAIITARPQTMAFKPDRLIIPATIAPMFTVNDIKVGNRSQLPQNGDLPGEAFLPNTEGAMLDFDTCQTSQDLILVVTNISGGALQFRACFYGKSLES